MEHISSHMADREKKRDRVTERGELMDYFRETLNRARVRDGLPALSMARMGRLLQGLQTQDLYYLKSVCDHAHDFSKKFWWEINPKNHALQPHQSELPKKKAAKRAPRTHG